MDDDTTETFLLVHHRNPSPDSWPRVIGPFDDDDTARAYAEEHFPKSLWTTEEALRPV